MNIFSIIGLLATVVVFVYASCYLKYPDKNGLHFLPLFIGIMLLFNALSEFKEKRKKLGFLLISVSL